jgi:hypothetical protein
VSDAAENIVHYIVEKSENGGTMDLGLSPDLVREVTALSDDDIVDALDELESQGFVRSLRSLSSGPLGFDLVGPEPALFAKFDKHFRNWDPAADALRIAADLVNELDGAAVSAIAGPLRMAPTKN